MNLPNRLTLARICLIPVFVAFFYLRMIPGNYFIALAVFAIAAFTDFLDGHIARSRGLVTNFGKFLDPIADKVLVSTALIVICTEFYGKGGWDSIVVPILVSIIMARELIISGFRMLAAERKIVLAADMLGKVKTTVQDVTLCVLLAARGLASVGGALGSFTLVNVADYILIYGGIGLLGLCAILTVISGINYLVKNKQVLKEEPTKEEKEAEHEGE